MSIIKCTLNIIYFFDQLSPTHPEQVHIPLLCHDQPVENHCPWGYRGYYIKLYFLTVTQQLLFKAGLLYTHP